MGMNTDFVQSKEDREKLSFFKIFQGADLSSENMRAFPYNFIRNVPEKDLSSNMVISTQWGSSWEVEISKNPRFYYMEKRGWNKFVRDNSLGENEFVTFTHKGNMRFCVNIYEENGKEVFTPREPRPMASFGGINKDVKKEVTTCESGAELNVRKKKAEDECETSKKKKIKSKEVESGVPEFKITIKKSYLKYLPFPAHFSRNHIMNESKMFKIHRSNGNGSWKVCCFVGKTQTIFTRGWSKLARQNPLSIGDICTLKLIKPTECLLVVSNKAGEEITP